MELFVGKTRIVSLVEQTIAGLELLIKEANPESLGAIDWLKPDYVNDNDECTGLIQSFVIDTGKQTIVVDTCVGDDRGATVRAELALATTRLFKPICHARL